MISFKEDGERLKYHLTGFYNMVEYERKKDPTLGVGYLANRYVDNETRMENDMQEYCNYMKEIDRKNRRLLNAITAVKGKTFYKHLATIIEESEGLRGLAEIVKEPIGKFQKEQHGRKIPGIWVDQTTDGGYTGDTFAGTVCVQISENKYYKFNYEM
jgi:hypothetical protein